MASIDYAVGDNWGSGFIGNMAVVAGAQALHGWTVEFDATFDISNIWNAEIVSHVGTHYVIRNAAWNADVPAGGQASFGFQATPGTTGTAASGFTVNGVGDPGEPPVLSIGDASIIEGNTGTTQLTFSVKLSEAASGPVTVHYATGDGTAKAGSDYTARSGTLTFAAGETVKTITVPILGDRTVEPNEAFVVMLSQATGATIADGSARAVIRNDDSQAVPGLSVADASVTEGNSGTRDLAFTVTLSQAATGPVTVAYATANGSATAGADYAALSGSLTFAAGETSKVVHVQVTGDTIVEGNETLTLKLSSPSGATIVDGTATGTITNDDVTGLPRIRITDSTFKEGSAGSPGIGTFKVTLSQASASAVTVNFATRDATAVAGSDYVGRTGTLTFAPGETEKTIRVRAIGDATVEGNETFRVVLTNADGAVIGDNRGIGTLTNDDTGKPTLGISDVSVAEGDPGDGGVAPGWFSTSGNQIVDAAGNVVQIAGVNWFGFESETLAPHGLWTRGYKEMMDQMAAEGFNTIRLPFSNDTLHSSIAPNGIDFNKNPDLQGLSALQIMDKIIDYAGQIGLKVILDHHRNDIGAGPSANGLWYDSRHSEADWIADWRTLAQRYADDPTVIGADLHNEPYNGTWGGGGANDWAAAAERAGNAIGAVNPNWLIFVEGVGSYQGQPYWWGGNLMGVRDRPIELDVGNKLVYSAHDYPNSVYAQPWFQGADFAADLPAKFDEMWGYIYREGIAPVYIGEFGTRLNDPKDAPWFEALTSYLAGDFDNDGESDLTGDDRGPSWTFWSWNPNSTDTGGILGDDWRTVYQNKLDYLEPIQFDFDGDVAGGGHHADFVLTLSEAATTTITVAFHTVPGDATSADFTSRSGTVTFAPGERSKTISIPITADDLAEGNERFTVVLTNAVGATLTRATGTATIVDDDAAAARLLEATPSAAPADAAASMDLSNVALLSMWSAATDNGGWADVHPASTESSGTPSPFDLTGAPGQLN